MAYFQEDENDQQQAQGMNQAPVAPNANEPQQQTVSGAQSSEIGNAPSAPQAPSQPTTTGKAPASSGMGGNSFQNYLKANQGKAQNNLGSQVQTNVLGAANQAKNSIMGGQTAFGKQLEAGSLANRDTAMADVAKAIQQARNIYKGDINADKAAQQQMIAGAQGDIASTNAYKAQETAAIQAARQQAEQAKNQVLQGQELAKAQKAYQDMLAKANSKDAEMAQVMTSYNPLNSAATQFQQVNKSAQQADALKKAYESMLSGANSSYDTAIKDLDKRQSLLGAQDTRLSGLQSQLEKANQQLEYLNNPNLVSEVNAADQSRFADVINAAYRGPQSMRQAGLYDPAQKAVSSAQTKLNQVGTAQGRQDLLNSIYGQNKAQYSRGLSGFDSALLNTNRPAIQSILDQKQNIGSLQGQLDKAQAGTELAATNRANEIRGIKENALSKFGEEQTAQRALTEQNIDKTMADAQKFADQLRSGFTNNTGTQNLSAAEAAILGLQSGEGLYGLGSNVVQTRDLSRDKVISRDDQARLAALSQLAGLDQAKRLSTENLYSDASKAGTQKATDILDRDAVRQAVANAEQNFRDTAAGTTVTGYGKGKGSSGGLFGSKSATAKKTLTANLKDALAKGGAYDFNKEINRETLGSNDILNNLTNALTYMQQGGQNAGTVQGTPSTDGRFGEVSQPGLNAGDALIGTAGINDPEFLKSVASTPGMESLAGLASLGAGLGGAAYNVPIVGEVAGALAGAVSGGLSGSSSKAKAKAQKKALSAAKKDLQQNFQNTLTGQGYFNRTNVTNDDPVAAQRAAALEALLRQIG